MLQGNLRSDPVSSTPRQQTTAYYINKNALAVKLHQSGRSRLVIGRSQIFSKNERALAEEFVVELGRVAGLEAPPDYEADLLNTVPRRVAARHLHDGDPHRLLTRLLEGLETWSSTTYEGQRISVAFALVADKRRTNVSIDDLWDKAFGPVLSNGVDTVFKIGPNGDLTGLATLTSSQAGRPRAPARFGGLATRSAKAGVAAALTRQGEILVFKAGELRFAKRAGQWLHYAHEAIVKRMTPPRSEALRDELYATCLDVAFARTGGCIGVVDAAKKEELLSRIGDADKLSTGASYKAQLLRQVVQGRKFHKLHRRVRLELLSMDGATILDSSGVVLGAGVILEIPQGERDHGGGGRTAAAIYLSDFGLGMKISEDGSIRGYKDGALHFEA